MERLRNERLSNASPQSKITFQRCDSDPRLCLKKSTQPRDSRTLNFVSPTRNRVRQSQQQLSRQQRRKLREDIGNVVFQCDNTNNDPGDVCSEVQFGNQRRKQKEDSNKAVAYPIVFQCDTTNNDPEDADSEVQFGNQRRKRQEDINKAVARPVVSQCDTTNNDPVYTGVQHGKQRRKQQEDIGMAIARPIVLQCDATNNEPDDTYPATQHGNQRRKHQEEIAIAVARPIVFQCDTTNNDRDDEDIYPAVQGDAASTSETSRRHLRSALAKNVAERRSRSTERRPSVVWNTEDSMPFLECGASFQCAVCDMSIPFTNCALCSAETEVIIVDEGHVFTNNGQEFVVAEIENRTQDSIEEVERSDNRNGRGEILAKSESQSSEEKKELEEFYDEPTKS